jgi:hypothetical protein
MILGPRGGGSRPAICSSKCTSESRCERGEPKIILGYLLHEPMKPFVLNCDPRSEAKMHSMFDIAHLGFRNVTPRFQSPGLHPCQPCAIV